MSVRKLYSRKAAQRVADRAHEQGVPRHIANYVAFAARKNRLRYALAYAMFEQESNFEPIYGHDLGGIYSEYKRKVVTRANYRKFRAEVIRRQGVGANGVGLGQPTYWTYIRDHPGLWKQRVQVYLSTSILAGYVHSMGEYQGVGAYNGGPSSPNTQYANQVLLKAKEWRTRLKGDS